MIFWSRNHPELVAEWEGAESVQSFRKSILLFDSSCLSITNLLCKVMGDTIHIYVLVLFCTQVAKKEKTLNKCSSFFFLLIIQD